MTLFEQRHTLPRTQLLSGAEALETFDHLHISASIALDGSLYYQRTWDLGLSNAEWAWVPSA